MAALEALLDLSPIVLPPWAAHAQVGGTLLQYTQGEVAPSDAQFALWLARVQQGGFSRLLIHSQGGEPTAAQRGMVAAHFSAEGRRLPRTVILSDRAVARAVLTALGWLVDTTPMKAFAVSELTDALAWLGDDVPANTVADALARLRVALHLASAPKRNSLRRSDPTR